MSGQSRRLPWCWSCREPVQATKRLDEHTGLCARCAKAFTRLWQESVKINEERRSQHVG